MSKSFKYVNDFEFPREAGYSGSAGQTMVKGYARSGKSSILTEGERMNQRILTEGERMNQRNMAGKERADQRILTEGERMNQRNMTEKERIGVTEMCEGGKYAKGGATRAKDSLRNERAEMARVKMESRSERKDAGDEMKRIRREERYDEARVKQPAR